MVQTGVIQVDNVVINAEGSVALSDNLSIPKWIKTNAEWWSSGAISDSDFKSGIQYMIKEEVISFEDKPQRQIDPPSLQIDAGHEVDPETAQLIFKTATQNLVSMTYLQKIKAAEYDLIKNSYDIALSDYSKNKDQTSMTVMSTLGNAEQTAKTDSDLSIKILKKSVELARDSKDAAIKSGLSVIDLESLVVDQQFEIDSMNRHFESLSEIKSAYRGAEQSKIKANEMLQNSLLSEFSHAASFKQLSITEQNSVSDEIRNIEYSDILVSVIPCSTQSQSIFANFIFGLKIQYAFGDEIPDVDIPCDDVKDRPLVTFGLNGLGQLVVLFVDLLSDEDSKDIKKLFTDRDDTARDHLDSPKGQTETIFDELGVIATGGFGYVLDPHVVKGNDIINDDKDADSLEDIVDGLLDDDGTSFENEPIDSVLPELEGYLGSPDESETNDSSTNDDETDDGPTTETSPSGASTTTLVDGTTITTDTDGTITRIDPDGTKTTTHTDGTIVVKHPDGTFVTTQPDGTTTVSNPDGSGYISYPDGTNVTIHPDGSTDTVNPDGSATSRDPDGNIISGTTYDDDLWGTINEPISTTNSDGTVTTVYPDGTSVWLTNDGSKATITYPDGSIERTSVGFNFNSGGAQIKIGTNTWNFDNITEAYAAVEDVVEEYLSDKTSIDGPYNSSQSYSLPAITTDDGRQYPAYQLTPVQYSSICNGEAHYISNGPLVGATTLSLGSYVPIGNCGFGTVSNYPIQNITVEGNILNAYLNHLGLSSFPPVPEDTTGSYSGSSDPEPPSDSGLN